MRVLLIEDNPGDALLLQEAFLEADLDFQISVACDGEVALNALDECLSHQSNSCPDLIMLDLNLPKMNGHEVLKELKTRATLRSIPVIVLTSSRAERDVSTAYELHCNAYFCKPSTFSASVQLIKVIMDFWQKTVPYPRVPLNAICHGA